MDFNDFASGIRWCLFGEFNDGGGSGDCGGSDNRWQTDNMLLKVRKQQLKEMVEV